MDFLLLPLFAACWLWAYHHGRRHGRQESERRWMMQRMIEQLPPARVTIHRDTRETPTHKGPVE